MSDRDVDATEPLSDRLTQAVLAGDAEEVRALIGAGAPVDVVNVAGETLLHLAAAGGHDQIVELLLGQAGVDVNAKTVPGATALAVAARAGHERVIELLLARPDIDPNLVDAYRCTPLHQTVRGDHRHVAQQLLAHPATNVDITSRPFRQTAAEAAEETGRDALAQLLRDAVPTHSFGDILSDADDYFEPEERTGTEPIPRLPYDKEPWPWPDV